MRVSYNVIVFKEGDIFVSYSPQLDLSSCGKTPVEARKMLREAVMLFIEEAEKMGTLEDILTECGYEKDNDHWIPSSVYFELAVGENV